MKNLTTRPETIARLDQGEFKSPLAFNVRKNKWETMPDDIEKETDFHFPSILEAQEKMQKENFVGYFFEDAFWPM